MPLPKRTNKTRGGVKVGLLAWLLGAPLLVILVGYLAC